MVAVIIKFHLSSWLFECSNWRSKVSKVEHEDLTAICCSQVLAIVVKSKGLDSLSVLNINELILLMHLVNTAD